jgi:hypothetical protein
MRREELVAVVVEVVAGLSFTVVLAVVGRPVGVSVHRYGRAVFEASAAQAEMLVREGWVNVA